MVIPVIAAVAATSIATSAAVIAAVGVIGASVLGMAAAFAITMIGSKVFGQKSPNIPQQDLKRTIKEAAANRRIIYGTVRAGGVLVYASSSGKENRYLDMVIALAHGRIHDIDPIFWVNDDKTDDPKFNGLINMYVRKGYTQNPVMEQLIANKPEEWTNAHTLNGIAYVYVRLKYDSNAFQSGVPNLSFVIKGRPVYDPRIKQMVHSNNPALCILDWLRSKEGKDVPNDLIDFDSFITAANICDELVPSIDLNNEVDGNTGFVKRYTLDGVIDMSAAPSKIIEEMQSSCHGNLVFSQGKYRFYAGAYSYPTFTITTEMLRDAPIVRMKPSRNELFNIVSGSYVEPKHNWSETDFPPQRDNRYIKRYQGEEIKQDIKLPFTTNGAIAQRLAKIQLIKGNNTITVTLNCNWAVLSVRLWDVVELNIPEIFQVGTTFRVTEFSFAEGGGIDLTLSSEMPQFYDWNYQTDEKLIDEPKKPVSDNGKPNIINNLTISGEPNQQNQLQISATWEQVNDSEKLLYEVVVQRSSKTSTKFKQVFQTSTFEPRCHYILTESDLNYLYQVKVRVITNHFRKSDWVVSDSVLPTKSVAKAPEQPTNVSVIVSDDVAEITWKTPANLDYDRSNVYVSSESDIQTSELLDTIISGRATYITKKYQITQQQYYWISAVDVSGNESDKIFAGSVRI